MANELAVVGDSDFKEEVLDAVEPVVVDFWAAWCPPCRALVPVLDSLAAQFRGAVRFVQVDVDASQGVSQQYGIRAMPTLLVFRGGRVVDQIVGAAPRAKLEAWIRRAAAI